MAWEVDRDWERDAARATVNGREVTRGYTAFWLPADGDPDPYTPSDILAIEALYEQHGVSRGHILPEFTSLFCTDIEARRDAEHPFKFPITVKYEEPVSAPGFVAPGITNPTPETQPDRPESAPPEPWERPGTWGVVYQPKDEYEPFDVTGTRVLNTAGDPMTDIPPVRRIIIIYTLTRWYEAWNIDAGAGMVDRVNDAEYDGKAAFSLRIDKVIPTQKVEKGRAFWEVVFIVWRDDQLWIPTRILSRGPNYIHPTTGVWGPIGDVYARRMNGQALLDEDGNITDTPYFMTNYEFYLSADFDEILG